MTGYFDMKLKRIFYMYVFSWVAAAVLFPLLVQAEAANPNYRSLKDVEALKTYFRWTPERQPLISAHRGGPEKGFPENALETFENVLGYAPCLIECDIRPTADGRLVMLHDDTLDRTTTGKGPVIKHTLAQLKTFFLKDPHNTVTGFRIPTLGETLEWARGKAVMALDVKRDTRFEDVIAAIRKHRAEPYIIFIVYSLEDLKRVHRMAPDLVVSAGATGVKSAEKLLDAGVPYGNITVFAGVSEPDPEVYRMFHKKGIYVCLGTMHNLDNKAKKKGIHVYQHLYKNGADILSTDFVPLVHLAIKGMSR